MLMVVSCHVKGSSISDIQEPSCGRGCLSTALFNYKEVLKAALVSAMVVVEEGKILYT